MVTVRPEAAESLAQPFKVDLWMRKDTAYDRERFGRRQQVEMFGRPVWVASAEDTILSKLDGYRISPPNLATGPLIVPSFLGRRPQLAA